MNHYRIFKEIHNQYENNPDYITTSILIEIAANLSKVIEKKNISKTEIARRINKPDNYTFNILKGYIDNITIKDLVEIAIAIGETPKNLSDICSLFGDKAKNK